LRLTALSQIKATRPLRIYLERQSRTCLSLLSIEKQTEDETMTASARILPYRPQGIGVIAMLFLLAPGAYADCARDSYGEVYCGGGQCQYDRNGIVWCSRYFLGGVARTRDGRVVCGKGQCATDLNGRIYCSSATGGSVVRDSRGRVRCYGRCEPATAEQCENTRADAGG
jgi:hypothetical protein